MLRSNFDQQVFINNEFVYVSDMGIREGVDATISQFDFRVPASVNSETALDQLELGADVAITQTASGRSITWLATIEEIDDSRLRHDDYYIIKCIGEAEKLTRRKFTYVFQDLNASDMILDAMSRFGGYTGISTAGVEENTDTVGVILLREETLYDLFTKISKITGWTWRVTNGVLEFFDAQTKPAPFQLKSADNIVSDTLKLKRNIAEVRNVLRAEAYEYKSVITTKTVNGCAKSIYGQKFNPDEWEIADTPRITSPIELTEEYINENDLSNISVDIDLFTGRISFSRPPYIEEDNTDAINQNVTVTVEYNVRRKVLVEGRQAASIAQYDERQGVFNAGNGGDDIETVFKKVTAELERKAFPLVTGSCASAEFGLRAGDWVTVDPFGRIEPFSMRVTSLRHTTSGADLRIDLELSSRNFVGSDPVPEIVARVENLEKQDLDPRSISGRIIREIGGIAYEEVAPETLNITDTVDVVLATVANISGGGSTNIIGRPFQGSAITPFSGGGSFNAVRFAGENVTFTATGGGSINVTPQEIGLFEVTSPVSGGGELNVAAVEAISNSRTIESGPSRGTHQGGVRVLETKVINATASFQGGGQVNFTSSFAVFNQMLTEDGFQKQLEDGTIRQYEDN